MQIQNVRFIIAAITTFSAYAVYVSRVNLSIAIIAMVEDGHQSASSSSTNNNETLSPPFSTNHSLHLAQTAQVHNVSLNGTDTPHPQPSLTPVIWASKKSVETPLISQNKFHWDQTEQGHILGAFFYGYILFQIPGARFAESVGAKWIILAANAGSALISLLFPLSTQLNSIHLLMLLRFVMGLCQSAFFPAAYVLFCRWLPERERSVLLPIMFIGSNMGSISTYIMSSYLISSSYGWPSVFYVSGFVCTLVTLLWCIFGSNGPDDNPLITDKERIMIESSVNSQSSENNSLDGCECQTLQEKTSTLDTCCCCCLEEARKMDAVDNNNNNNNNNDNKRTKRHKQRREEQQQPSWSKFLKSIPIWTLILSMYGNEWSNVVLCYELPSYLNTALGFPIEQNGVINSFFQLSYTLASPIMSSLGAYMLVRHVFGMRKIHVRKLFQSLATFGQLACFVSVPICGDNRGLIITFMFSAIVFKACSNAGDIMVSGDLSPEYAGTIFAFANSIGNTAGFFVPLLAGAFVENAYDREQWTPFWLTTAAIMGGSGLIFLIFGETRRQDFTMKTSSQQLGSIQNQERKKPIELKATAKLTTTTDKDYNNNNNNNNNRSSCCVRPFPAQQF